MPNARIWTSQHSLFHGLKAQPADPLLSLIAEFGGDPRTHKVDLGIGVYRDDNGATPVMRAVKAAERLLAECQKTKSYLGPEGDRRFVELLKPLVCGAEMAASERLTGVQTPGGTGALRLAADLIAASAKDAKIWLGLPTWPNHRPVFAAAGIPMATYRYFDIDGQRLCFDGMMNALKDARPGDAVLLQGCCHNPTGTDLDLSQWAALAGLLAERGLIPLIDCAYQGLGRDFAADAAGIGIVLSHAGEALIAYSCDKNFGLYRERTGALFAFAQDAGAAGTVLSNLLSLARANWSMPPDHGAAIVRTILEDEDLKHDWNEELESMRKRIAGNRQRLAAAHPALAHLARQHGMFSMLPLAPASIARLKAERGIYMAGSGRINVASLRPSDVAFFAESLRALESEDLPPA